MSQEKPAVKPGDRWITANAVGVPVERTRTDDGQWDEVELDRELPGSLQVAHEALLKLQWDLAELRRRCPEARTSYVASAAPVAAAPTAPRPTKKPCIGCGKK